MEENDIAVAAQKEPAVPVDGAGEDARIPAGDQAEDLKKDDFEKLIRGTYKAEFDERVRKIIDKRFKEMKSMKEQAARVKPVMDALSEKYGETDTDRLCALLRGERGEMKKNPRETMKRGHTLRTVLKWRADADAIARERKDFDLRRELANGVFSGLLRAGVDLKTAYGFVHRKEEMENALRRAVVRTREETIREMRGRMLRPAENGGSGFAGGMKPLSPSGMSRFEREEIEKRASRGEKIYF